MMFQGKGKPLSQRELDEAGAALGVSLPALWTVMTVETKGCGFLPDRRPIILFERHIFHRRTGGRYDKRAPDISNAIPGGYGAAGAPQYDRLEKAVALDRTAALESTSWGLGQIMGFNAAQAGFSDVEAMVAAMADSEDAQFAGIAGFIASASLARYLQKGDWSEFAYRYNGPDFQKNNYDDKLAQCYARYAVGPLPDLRVRATQLYLGYLGYGTGGVDGWFGKNTQAALIRFQKAQGMEATGVLDDACFAALEKAVYPD
jgi:hypothetical protein